MSVAYYDEHAEQYFRATIDADLTTIRARFAANLKPGGRILDAGCGSGRDALAFSNAGYSVTAFDGSGAMARKASQHTGLKVHHLTFDQVKWQSAFDGVWACASLLHVDRSQLSSAVSKLANALVHGGAMFACFKQGSRDRCVDGRYFADLTEHELERLLNCGGLTVTALWTSIDLKSESSREMWTNAIAKKS